MATTWASQTTSAAGISASSPGTSTTGGAAARSNSGVTRTSLPAGCTHVAMARGLPTSQVILGSQALAPSRVGGAATVYLPASSGQHTSHIPASAAHAKSYGGAKLGGSFVAQPVIKGIATSPEGVKLGGSFVAQPVIKGIATSPEGGAKLGGSFVAQPVIKGIATSPSLEGGGVRLGGSFVAQPVIKGIATSPGRGSRLDGTWAGVRPPDQLSRSWVDVPSAPMHDGPTRNSYDGNSQGARKSLRPTSSTRTSLSTFSTATNGTREASRRSPCPSASSSAASEASPEVRSLTTSCTSARPRQNLVEEGRVLWAGVHARLKRDALLPTRDSDSRGDAWSTMQTHRLGTSGEECRVPLQYAILLDKESVNSVSSAVDGLNSGRIPCPEGMCIVYSSSNGAYYLLYRADKKDTAEAVAAEKAGTREQPSVSASSRKQAVPATASGASGPGGASAGAASEAEAPNNSKPAAATAAFAHAGAGQQGVAKPAVQKDEVEISHRIFKLLKVIGRGAFGVVWSAKEQEKDTEIAIKAVTATDNASFASAAFEAELLELLTAAQSSSSKAHVPQYITHSATRTSAGGGTVRLAMSFIPGGTLDKWLYGISDEDHKNVDAAQLIDGHLPGGQQGCWLFDSTCSIVRILLTQLSRVFVHLSHIAFHRDVSSHNVMVDFPGGEHALRPEFALIDFGLAVRSGSWSREWRNSNLAGDPRYWAPSAWMSFAFGFKYVATHPDPGFQQQYIARMDHFSLGILGLEVLFALWHIAEAYEGHLPGLLEVRAAWCKFWVTVIRLFQMFHRQGAQDVRQFLAQSKDEGITSMVSQLKHLRQALRSAAQQAVLKRSAPLLRVLADLIDEACIVSWSDIPALLSEDAPLEVGGQDGEAPSPARRVVQTTMDPAIVIKRGDMSHRRIRSTGGTIDQELQRHEPDSGQSPLREARNQGQAPQQGRAASPLGALNISPKPAHSVIDNLSKSVTHVRNLSSCV